MNLSEFNHITLRESNLQRSLLFYLDIPGMDHVAFSIDEKNFFQTVSHLKMLHANLV